MTRWLHPGKPAVYLIAGAGGLHKIGMSRDPESRMRELQTGNGERLSLVATTVGGRSYEAELHARYAEQRRSGEWFALTAEQVEEVISEFDNRCPSANDVIVALPAGPLLELMLSGLTCPEPREAFFLDSPERLHPSEVCPGCAFARAWWDYATPVLRVHHERAVDRLCG